MKNPYRYVKAVGVTTPSPSGRQRILSLLGRGLIVLGVVIVGNVLFPIVSYELFTAPFLQQSEFKTPIPVRGKEIDTEGQTSKATDFTRPENWFPTANYQREETPSRITHYTLSIPKFNIEDAVVTINGDDLSKSLIHYPGTALPGKPGATVIFGHSILPQFFNPKNYMAIFSLLPTLELGDTVVVKFDGITYTYKVIDKVEVMPDNLAVLEQPYDNRYLRLVTCTPPGTYLRRAVITAILV